MLGIDVQEVERIFSVLVKLNCIKWQTHFRVDAPHHQANNVSSPSSYHASHIYESPGSCLEIFIRVKGYCKFRTQLQFHYYTLVWALNYPLMTLYNNEGGGG